MSNDTPCVLLLGLDGATYDLLDQLVDEGVMPNLGRIMAEGARGVLRSTIHPLTPPAWTTMVTGRSPGNHGVFDFIRVDRSGTTPGYTLATSADVKAPMIWDIASAAGRRITALNFPVTFPARKLNGTVIPGYVPWSYLGRAIHPRDAFRMLKERGVFKAAEMSTDWQHERKAVQGLAENQLDDWVDFHIVRERRWFEIARTLMQERPADLTAVLLDGVDRIQHLCWHLVHRSSRDRHTDQASEETRQRVLGYFREIDGFIADLIGEAGPNAQCFIVSDHGFTASGRKVFYANTFLEKQGWLTWKPDTPLDDQGRVALDENTEASTLIDWGGTKAYSLSSSSNAIFIRVADKPGACGVAPEDYMTFRDTLRRALLDLRDPDTGAQVISQVHTREEAFAGAHTHKAPDLTLALADYSFLSVLRADAVLKDRKVPYATHHPDGIFIATGTGIVPSTRLDPLEIADVAPTVLYALGLEIPAGLDGQLAEAAFAPDVLARSPARYGKLPRDDGEQAAADQLQGEAEAQIRERLKSLGYL